MTERHVSRWRLPSERLAAASLSTPTASPSTNADAHASATSLRYLDEFVRKLQCAPRLLEHQLFPDAKEITESMGLFNAVRRYVVHDNASIEEASGSTTSSDPLADGIVVVGDGNTPRSAALFAFRLKHWKCYSIDPAMELSSSSERAAKWESIENLVVIRNKIENVRIRLRRAVVVLVHAHVTLAQALSAVECEELVGVVTMPCCNWYGKQEELFGKQPDVVYDDFSILSDHRELRVWVDPRGDGEASKSSTPLALDQSAALMKGCVQKEFIADYGVSQTDESAKTSEKKQKKAEPVRVTALLKQTLQNHEADKRTPSPPPIATSVQLEAVADQIKKVLPDKTAARVLVLSAEEGPGKRANPLAQVLLARGFQNVFTLRTEAQEADDQLDVFTADVMKVCTGEDGEVTKSIAARLQSKTTRSSADSEPTYATTVTPVDDSTGEFSIDCVVDHGLLFRSLRNQPKKVCGTVFQQLVQLTTSFTTLSAANTPRLISVSPRKDWRKPEFFTNELLVLQLSSAQVAANGSESSVLFVYTCRATSKSGDDSNELLSGSSVQAQKKLHALRLKEALERDFKSVAGGLYTEKDLIGARESSSEVSALVQLSGVVQHLRRFTTGPSFFSVASSGSSSFHDHLQISVDPLQLVRWTERTDAATLTIDAVLRLLHKGDRVECVGEMTHNAQQQPMLRLHAMRFVQSEFQAYQ